MALTRNALVARAPAFALIRFFLTVDPAVALLLLLYLIVHGTGWQMLPTRMARDFGPECRIEASSPRNAQGTDTVS